MSDTRPTSWWIHTDVGRAIQHVKRELHARIWASTRLRDEEARTPEEYGNDPNTSRACVPPSASGRSPATPNTDSAASLQARSPGFRSLTMAVVCSCSTTSSPSPHLPGRSPHRVRLSSVAASQGSPPSHSLDGHWHTRVIRNPGTPNPPLYAVQSLGRTWTPQVHLRRLTSRLTNYLSLIHISEP